MDSEVQKAALLSHTMAAYISTLNKSLVDHVATQLVSDTSLWLSKIFRYICIGSFKTIVLLVILIPLM